MPPVKILVDYYVMIKVKDLHSLGTDEDCIGWLTNKLTELDPFRSQLSQSLHEATTKSKHFYKDLFN